MLLLSLLLINSLCYSQDSTNSRGYELVRYDHCQLNIDQKSVSGNTLSLTYETLPANQSGQNHNSLWLWRATEVPWKYKPMKKQLLPIDATQSGSYVLEEIEININTAYIACYSVDSTVEQICACAHLAANSTDNTSEWVSIELLEVAANSLSFRYRTMEGYLPLDYGNWFGVWEGMASPYNSFPPVGKGKPVNNSNINDGAINNITLDRGQTYTLIYYTGKKLTQAAAMIIFTVK
ncbi:MAG: hypothetical protein R2800_03835 [Flavipsychrobacter sp.]